MQALALEQGPKAVHLREDPVATPSISLFRLYALRAGSLILAVGLGSAVWPGILHHDKPWTLMQGVVHCMLAAMSALALVGLFHPLKVLPLLFFELAWKAIWLGVIALPLWLAHRMDADTSETTVECLMAVVFLIVVPWSYVFARYVTSPGDRWR